MLTQFRNRTEAGRLLAARLMAYAGRTGVLVLALPRGGVPIGLEVSRALRVPLDVFVVRKLGVPGQEELAMGAIASGGVQVLNREVVEGLRIPPDSVQAVAAREYLELARREELYRKGRPFPEVRAHTVILVDDGIATGSTMRAAIRSIRDLGAERVVVAVPTAALSTVRSMRAEADEVVTVMLPVYFSGVGQWYEDFSPTTDEEVCRLLRLDASPVPPEPGFPP